MAPTCPRCGNPAKPMRVSPVQRVWGCDCPQTSGGTGRVRAAYPFEAEGLYVHLGDLIEYLADALPDKAANVVTSYLVDLGAKLESDQ